MFVFQSNDIYVNRFGYGGKGGLDTTFLFVIELQPFMRFIPPFRFAYNRYLERTKPAMGKLQSVIHLLGLL